MPNDSNLPNGPFGPTEYIHTSDPDVFLAFDWNPDEGEYNRNSRKVRREDVPGLAMQTAARIGLRAAVHSYVHIARRPNVKPYFKLARAGAAPQAAAVAGPWNVPDLCATYNEPNEIA